MYDRQRRGVVPVQRNGFRAIPRELSKRGSQRSEVIECLDVMVRLLRDDCRLCVISTMDNTMTYMLDLLTVDAFVPLETIQKVRECGFMIANRGLR